MVGDDDSGPAESQNDWDLERIVQILVWEQSQECGSPPYQIRRLKIQKIDYKHENASNYQN
jgi:hypothetical protein